MLNLTVMNQLDLALGKVWNVLSTVKGGLEIVDSPTSS